MSKFFRRACLLAGLASASLLTSCASRPSTEADGLGATPQLVASNPNVLAAHERVEQARAQETIARANLFPAVDLTASRTEYTNHAIAATSETSEQNVGLSASLSLSKAFAGVNGTRAAYFSTMAKKEALRGSVDQIILELALTQAAIDRATKHVAIRKELQAELKTFLSRQKTRFTAGKLAASDLENIRARIKLAESEIVRLDWEITSNKAKLRSLAGDSGMSEVKLVDLAQLIPGTEDEAVAMALQRNPALREAEWEQQSAGQNLAKATKTLFPDISVSFNTPLLSDQYASTSSTNNNEPNVRLDLKVPLFDGGRRLAEVKLEKSRLREQTYTVLARKHDTVSKVVGQWQGVMAAREQQALAKAGVKRYANALSGTLTGERIGARSSEQVLQAYERLTDARVTVVDAQSQIITRSHELLAYLGALVEAYR